MTIESSNNTNPCIGGSGNRTPSGTTPTLTFGRADASRIRLSWASISAGAQI
jgi:hypothetical protein